MVIYLYIKTHNKTGLKYLGKTARKDPYSYSGSGIDWIAHLEKHGYDFTTTILQECSNNEEVKKYGLYYSSLWNIVESKEWANRIFEGGEGGTTRGFAGKRHSTETKQRMSESHKGKIVSAKTREKMSAWQKGRQRPDLRGKSPSVKTRLKISIATKGKPKGPMSAEQKEKISVRHKGKVLSEETKRKMSAAKLGVSNLKLIGRKYSNEHRKNISEGQKGRIHSPETRLKISLAKRKQP